MLELLSVRQADIEEIHSILAPLVMGLLCRAQAIAGRGTGDGSPEPRPSGAVVAGAERGPAGHRIPRRHPDRRLRGMHVPGVHPAAVQSGLQNQVLPAPCPSGCFAQIRQMQPSSHEHVSIDAPADAAFAHVNLTTRELHRLRRCSLCLVCLLEPLQALYVIRARARPL